MASQSDPSNSTTSHGEPVDTATPVVVEPKGTETSPMNATNMAPSAVDDSSSSSSQARGAGGVVAGSSAPTEELGKVTVFNVGLHTTCAQLEKLLKANGIEYKKAKKPPSISHAVLAFETEAQRTAAMEKLGKLPGPRGGELMKAVLTKHNDGKRRTEGDGRDDRSKRPRQEEAKTVAQATASLYGVKTYSEQLAFKEKTLMDDLFLRLPQLLRNEWEKRLRVWKFNQKMRKKGDKSGGGLSNTPPELRCPLWCRTFKRRDGTVPFEVSSMVPSPEQEGYRNKCEFTLSRDGAGKAATGFRAGRFQAGVAITVESPKDCPQVHEDMKRLCVQMDAFMQSSQFPPYDETSKTGVWRFLLVRRSVADNETMAKLVVNLSDLEGTEEWKAEEKRLIDHLRAGAREEGGTNLVSLWVQPYSGVSTPDEASPLRLLWGKERIEEELLGLRFTISPNSFFQVNTKGAEALYKVVIENLELGDDVMLMDVCCGAGTIGICAAAAGGAKRVFGVDLCLPAIEDAKKNAAANGVDNCEFECGKAEDIVSKQLTRARKQHRNAAQAAQTTTVEGGNSESAPPAVSALSKVKFAAVLDPPRSGVHAKCLRSLRETDAIQRLVYVSCNPTKSLPKDALVLCSPRSNSTRGVPFRPVKAIPVDMFPHTPHMELVIVFERVEDEKAAKAASGDTARAADSQTAPAAPAAAAAAAAAAEGEGEEGATAEAEASPLQAPAATEAVAQPTVAAAATTTTSVPDSPSS